jgi:Tfp pilus assembly protein PilO
MTIQKRDKVALILGAAAAVIFVLMDFAVLPAWDFLQESRDDLPIRERQLQKSRQLAVQTANYTAAASSAQAALREAENGLLASATPAVASAELQEVVGQLATAEGIEIRSNQFLPAKPLASEYTQVPLGIDFQCRLDQLVSFLTHIEQLPRFVAVQKMIITSSNGKEKVLGVYLQVAGVVKAGAKQGRSPGDPGVRQ